MASNDPTDRGRDRTHRLYDITLGYGPDDDVWPVTLLEAALSFARVADGAVANLGPAGSASSDGLTILFLLAQSIELALKTFLLLTRSQPRGYDPNRLKKIGHNLPSALTAAIAVGFPRAHPSDERLLGLLNDTYCAGRRLQYRPPGKLKLPLLRPVRELVQLYLTEVHRAATCGIADPDQVPGLSINAGAHYGGPSLDEFRADAAQSTVPAAPAGG